MSTSAPEAAEVSLSFSSAAEALSAKNMPRHDVVVLDEEHDDDEDEDVNAENDDDVATLIRIMLLTGAKAFTHVDRDEPTMAMAAVFINRNIIIIVNNVPPNKM